MNSELATQLYLVVEADAGEPALARLDAAMGVERVASLLVTAKPNIPFDLYAAAKIIQAAQKRGIAGLIAGSAADVQTVKADGIHLPWSETVVPAFAAARSALGDRTLAGADAGRSRHDAMTLGEAGADYIAFGIPQHVQDRTKAAERRLELVFWWSEIFEVPCVAFDVDSIDDARELAAAGADFITVALPTACSPADARAHVQKFADAIASATPAMA